MIRRPDFRQVTPTADELTKIGKQFDKRYGPGWPGRVSVPVRAEHLPCGRRIWYSGIGIGSHLRACPGHRPGEHDFIYSGGMCRCGKTEAEVQGLRQREEETK